MGFASRWGTRAKYLRRGKVDCELAWQQERSKTNGFLQSLTEYFMGGCWDALEQLLPHPCHCLRWCSVHSHRPQLAEPVHCRCRPAAFASLCHPMCINLHSLAMTAASGSLGGSKAIDSLRTRLFCEEEDDCARGKAFTERPEDGQTTENAPGLRTAVIPPTLPLPPPLFRQPPPALTLANLPPST